MRSKMSLVIVVFCFVILGYFFREKSQKLPGEGVIAEFIRRGPWLSVYANKTARYTDLANMEQLGSFRPGLSPGEAERAFGSPDRKIGPEKGAKYVEYHNQYGRIRIGEEAGSDGYVSHPLYFFPTDPRPGSFLPASITKHLLPDGNEDSILLFECGFVQPFLNVVIENGGITRVVWNDIMDVERRADPSQCVKE